MGGVKDSFKDFEASDRYFELYGVRKTWARTEHIPNGYYEPPRMNWEPAYYSEQDLHWEYRWSAFFRKKSFWNDLFPKQFRHPDRRNEI